MSSKERPKRIDIAAESACEALESILGITDYELIELLTLTPVSCADVASLAHAAHERGALLAVDATLADPGAAAPLTLGADIVVRQTGSGSFALKGSLAPFAEGAPEQIPAPSQAWRASSDVALAFASYLACHPKVGEVRYPGLKSDPSFETAARTLIGGFGPYLSVFAGGEWTTADVRGATLAELIARYEQTRLLG